MYKIMGKSKQGKEELDTAETRKEAQRLVGEYIMAFGPGWTVWLEKA